MSMADDEDLARKIFRITLEDKGGVDNDTYVESVALGMSQMRLTNQAIDSREPSAQHEDQAWKDYRTLYFLDNEAHHHVRAVTDVINTLDSTKDEQALAKLSEERAWLEKALREVMVMDVGTDTCNEQFRHAQLRLLQDTKEAAESIMRVIARRTKQDPNPEDNASEAVATGEEVHTYKERTLNRYSDRHLRRFNNAKPALLLAMFIALVLNILGHVTRPWCNAALGLLNLLLNTMLGNAPEGHGSEGWIPRDIRSVRKKFDLEAVTKTFATCARCSCTYPPTIGKKSPAMGKKSCYPERCSYKKYRGSKPCGQLLVKRTKEGGQISHVPMRPYVVQDFNSFLAGLLSCPGMEEAMDRGTMLNDNLQIWDIKDGTAMGEILGPDGKPFMDGLKRTDLRLAWSLSVDWFNPYGNKVSGKRKSVGSVAMGLLNLPPSLRYKAENMYLVGIIPGPREPSLDEINHFLWPVVDFFLPSWKDGTWFTKTTKHTAGRLSRSVIAVAVNDLPAARKLAGRAGPTANQMCGLCWLMKSDIADFDWEKWRRRTFEEHKAAAEQWKNAETKVERDKIFKQHGVRWSELLRLPYWDPTRFIVIDGMHNLFLGLVQYHFRSLIVIDKQASKELRKGQQSHVNSKDLQKGRETLMSNPTVSAMNRLRVKVLEALVQEYEVVLPDTPRPRKKEIIKALLVSS
jgi:Transposase family tnp2